MEASLAELDAVEVVKAGCLTFLVGCAPGGEFLGNLALYKFRSQDALISGNVADSAFTLTKLMDVVS